MGKIKIDRRYPAVFLIALLILSFVGTIHVAYAPELETMTILTNKDSTIDQINGGTNYGSTTTVVVTSWKYLGSPRNWRALLQFNITGIPPLSIIGSVTLKIYAITTGGAGRTYQVQRITGAWTEMGVTWNNQPAVDAALVEGDAPAVGGFWEIDVTEIFVVGETIGFRVKDKVETESSTIYETDFYSRERAGTGQDPRLVIEYYPGPTLTHSIANLEEPGDWIFEGRTQYDFFGTYETNYTGDIVSAGFRFLDAAGNNHTVWYDNSTKRTTVTSPEDGISAAATNVTIVFNVTYIHWSVMFNPTIPDTLNTTVWHRMTYMDVDIGWIATGEYFSIYNLGGFAELTASGYAGRTPGGDVFEIFAADVRVPILIPIQDFDVEEGARDAGTRINIAGTWYWLDRPESEGDLINMLTGWDIFFTEEAINHTVLLTNRLPSDRPVGSKAWTSYPFGMRIIDNPPTVASYGFSEYSFIRPITAADNEIVTVQWMWMTPEDTGTMGMCSVTDNGFYPYWAHGIIGVNTAARVRFSGSGIIQAYDGPVWTTLVAYTGYTWYNMTMVLNVTAQTYDVYVDEVLWGDDLAFPVACATLGNIGFYRDVSADNYTDIYVDDVEGYTDWDEDYGGDVKATSLFRYLQHWSVDWDFGVEEGKEYVKGASATPAKSRDDYSDHGFIEFGMDVCINETWENNFLVGRINITDGHIADKNNWVEFNVTWKQNGTYVKHDILYGLFEGYKLKTAPGAKDVTGWYFDIWFNRMNASTVVGARLNTKYFGMTDESAWGTFWYTDWNPMISDVTESSCFVDLDDSSGVTHSTKEVSLVRPWVRVYRTMESTFHYAIANTETEFRTTDETMSGIDAPPIKDTVTPDVPATGIATYLAASFKGIFSGFADTIVMGAVMMWSYFVGFMDTIFAFFGFPALVSTLLTMAGNFFGYMSTIISEGHLYNLIVQIFTVITSTFGHIIWWFTRVITTFTNIFTIVWQIFDGTYVGLGTLQDFWAIFNWDAWVDAVPILMILGWFLSIDQRARRVGGGWMMFFLSDIQIIMAVAQFVIGLMVSIVDMFTKLVFGIINAIPVVE